MVITTSECNIRKEPKENSTTKPATPFSRFQNNAFNLWKFWHELKPFSTLQTRLNSEYHSESDGSWQYQRGHILHGWTIPGQFLHYIRHKHVIFPFQMHVLSCSRIVSSVNAYILALYKCFHFSAAIKLCTHSLIPGMVKAESPLGFRVHFLRGRSESQLQFAIGEKTGCIKLLQWQ